MPAKNTNASLRQLKAQRKSLVLAITSLKSFDVTTLEKQLKGLKLGYKHEHFHQSSSELNVVINDQGITPLMVACDKRLPSVLRHLLEYRRNVLEDLFRNMSNNEKSEEDAGRSLNIERSKDLLFLVGDPMDRCDSTCGGNTAAHFAAHSGCTECTELLLNHADPQNSTDDAKPKGEGTALPTSRYAAWWKNRIINRTNAHGDTVLMMAIANGHLNVLEHVLGSVFPSGPPRDGRSSLGASDTFIGLNDAKNLSGDTALSLACGHGHEDIVRLLLEYRGGNALSKEELTRCHSVCNRAELELEKLRSRIRRTYGKDLVACYGSEEWEKADVTSKSQMELLDNRYESMRRCVKLVAEAHLETMKQKQFEAEKMAEELMADETFERHCGHKSDQNSKMDNLTRNKKKKKKKKKKKVESSVAKSRQTDESRRVEDVLFNVPMFKTLIDGTVVAYNKKACDHTVASDEEELGLNDGPQPSAASPILHKDHDLRRILLERSPEAESLCLDVANLLFTPHQMAMKLSPCQLDALEKLLRGQLYSVAQAREVQGRLLEKS